MSTVDEITEAELLEAIQAALKSDIAPEGLEPGTITRPRLMELYGLSVRKAQATLNRLLAEGVIRKDLVTYNDGWGYTQSVKGYRRV